MIKNRLGSSLASFLLVYSVGLPAIAQPLEQVIRAHDVYRVEAVVRFEEPCSVLGAPSAPIQTLLSNAYLAAVEIEDAYQRGFAFLQIGHSYVCLQQYESAAVALEEAVSATDEIEEVALKLTILKDTASLYGRSVGDLERMNATLTKLMALIDVESTPSAVGDYYREIEETARLYAETGQYQKLRDLVDLFDDDVDRLALVRTAAPSLSNPDSEAERDRIESLFSDFDLATIFRDFSQPRPDLPVPTPFGYALRDLLGLSDDASEEIGLYSDAEIEAFADEKISIIAGITGARDQIEALDFLGNFLLDRNQSRAALSIFDTAIQRLEAAVTAQGISSSSSFYATKFYVARAKAYFQLGEFDAAVLALESTENSPVAPSTQIESLLKLANLRTLPLTDAQRRELVARAEALLPRIESTTDEQYDAVHSLRLLSFIADSYANIGDTEKVSQLLPAITAALPASQNLSDNSFPAITYSRLLAVTGDFEAAIAFVESSESRELSLALPSHLVAAGQYELAEEKLAAITTTQDYFLAAKAMIDSYAEADDAYAFTVRTLGKLQSADMFAGGARLAPAAYDYQMLAFVEDTRATIARDLIEEYVLDLDLGEFRRIGELTAEENAAVRQLINTLENDWLRAELIQRSFELEEALSILDSDDDLIVPDGLLMYSVKELIEAGELSQAEMVVDRMRSPYAQSLALVLVANGYTTAMQNVQ